MGFTIMSDYSSIWKLLLDREELRLLPYDDATGRSLTPQNRIIIGNPTIGVGHNLFNGITYEQARGILFDDVNSCFSFLRSRFPEFNQWTIGRRHALVDMVFNLGRGGFLSFTKMIKALRAEDWDKAAAEMLDSDYGRAATSKRRAAENAEVLKNGS